MLFLGQHLPKESSVPKEHCGPQEAPNLCVSEKGEAIFQLSLVNFYQFVWACAQLRDRALRQGDYFNFAPSIYGLSPAVDREFPEGGIPSTWLMAYPQHLAPCLALRKHSINVH